MAERLLLLWDQKRVNVDGWEGFIFTRGVLKYKNYRWGPETLVQWRDQEDEIQTLKIEIRRLKSFNGALKTLLLLIVDRFKRVKITADF